MKSNAKQVKDSILSWKESSVQVVPPVPIEVIPVEVEEPKIPVTPDIPAEIVPDPVKLKELLNQQLEKPYKGSFACKDCGKSILPSAQAQTICQGKANIEDIRKAVHRVYAGSGHKC
jgi:hypothetical protein